MKLSSSKESNYWLIKIDGDLDASSSVELDTEISRLIEENQKHIFVDCEQLNYIASAGLGVFMSYLQDLTDKGVSMQLFNLNEKVFEVFKILGLDELINIVETKEMAVNTIQ
jgi:anti-sigma B factor antagonist